MHAGEIVASTTPRTSNNGSLSLSSNGVSDPALGTNYGSAMKSDLKIKAARSKLSNIMKLKRSNSDDFTTFGAYVTNKTHNKNVTCRVMIICRRTAD